MSICSATTQGEQGVQPLDRLLLPALKEWAVTCEALGNGDQTILLRKGGIREPKFKPVSGRFLLFPTSFHSDATLIKSQASAKYSKVLDQEPKGLPQLPLEYFCQLTGHWTTSDPAVLSALDALHIWTPAWLDARLRWRKGQPLTLMEVKVHRLPQPLVIDNRDELWGCFSWVDAAHPASDSSSSAVQAVEWAAAQPVLGDVEFAQRQRLLRQALAGVECEEAGGLVD